MLKNSRGCSLQINTRHKSALYLLSVGTGYMEDRKRSGDRLQIYHGRCCFLTQHGSPAFFTFIYLQFILNRSKATLFICLPIPNANTFPLKYPVFLFSDVLPPNSLHPEGTTEENPLFHFSSDGAAAVSLCVWNVPSPVH